jgi:RNA polymerase sigma factor (sigma-70 family)
MAKSLARRVERAEDDLDAAEHSQAYKLARVSPRQEEILGLLAKGYRYREIAEILGVSIETIRTQLHRAYEKLQVSSRTEAVVKYLGKENAIAPARQ